MEIVFSVEDKILLAQLFSENPCNHCLTERLSCCGCDKQKKYNEMLKPYKDKGLLEYKMTIEKIKENKHRIMWIQGEINSLKAKLPKELRDIK